MGFDFEERRNKYDWDTVYLALQTYKELHGHLLVPFSYKIPSDDTRWPEELRGLNLGNICFGIRNKGFYVNQHKEELLSIGFVFEKQKHRSCWKKQLS
jgi:Helicase associated domain